MGTVSEIKLIRTDTTLDLSQKAEKVCAHKRDHLIWETGLLFVVAAFLSINLNEPAKQQQIFCLFVLVFLDHLLWKFFGMQGAQAQPHSSKNDAFETPLRSVHTPSANTGVQWRASDMPSRP